MKTISKYELELLGKALSFAREAWIASRPDVDPFDFEGIYPVNATKEQTEALDDDLLYTIDLLACKVETLYDAISRTDKYTITK